jgi:hypothetical protein
MLFLFRVKGGCHVEDGVTYRKGDMIETDVDLAATFRGKFERVYTAPTESKGVAEKHKKK